MSESETRECNSAECNWTGPAGDCVHPKNVPDSLLCPMCNETTFVVGRVVSIDQHAEAAADEIGDEHGDPNGTPVEVIVFRHMQAAIDEATAPLRARIAVLEGLGPLVEEYASCCADFARYNAGDSGGELWRKIDAILKGGAPEQCAEIAKGGGA
jgi:hypothetical protein